MRPGAPSPAGLWAARLLAGLPTLAALAAFADPAARFDHRIAPEHARPCSACHRVRAASPFALRRPVSRPLHAPCDSCHEAAWFRAMRSSLRAGPGRAPFCASCHVGRRLRRGGEVQLRFPPYRPRGRSQLTLATFDHGEHARIDGERCESCHGDRVGEAPPAAHAACGRCHEAEVEPVMTACEGCHALGDPGDPSAFSRPSRYRVRAFAHAAHAEAAPAAACRDCHLEVEPPPGQPIGRPTKPTCETCHDGQQAFDVVGAACARCHEPARPGRRRGPR